MIALEARKKLLFEIINLLESGGDFGFAAAVRGEIGDSVDSVESFLVSNELWGGSGSLADSAFAFDEKKPNWPDRAQNRAAFEKLMIKLGHLQIDAGHANVRTRMWVETFEYWRDTGIR